MFFYIRFAYLLVDLIFLIIEGDQHFNALLFCLPLLLTGLTASTWFL